MQARKLATRLISGGRDDQPGDPLNVPIIPATAFRADGSVSYSRDSNPTWEACEELIGDAEGGVALTFASGMAALTAAFETAFAHTSTTTPHVASPTIHYSGTTGLLDMWNADGRIRLTHYDPGDPATIQLASHTADIVLVETPANPTMDIVDMSAVTSQARGIVIADNTYATPVITQPLRHGVDIVVHSASKYLAGHSDALMGAVVTSDEDFLATLRMKRALLGATPGVLEAWLTTRGIRTLDLRMRQACDNASMIAHRLAELTDVLWVRYPGLETDPGHEIAARQMSRFGAVVTFAVPGGLERAEQICHGTQIWHHATSLGGVESTLERRRRHEFENPEVPDDLIRLSVGCEDAEDLWSDLHSAIVASAPTGDQAQP